LTTSDAVPQTIAFGNLLSNSTNQKCQKSIFQYMLPGSHYSICNLETRLYEVKDWDRTDALLCRVKETMKAAGISELKRELLTLPPQKVLELCLQLARFKKENKEFLSYLLFDSHNKQGYVENIKNEIDEQFSEMPKGNWYLAKKALRKILKGINKYCKHTTTKESEVEMLMHFCISMKNSGLRYRSYKALSSLYDQQLKKLGSLIEQVHEDLRFDYARQLEKLE
jgi:hypothetical protein